MLAYRHAFHAGNHADVLKHAIALYCLDYLQQKPVGLTVVDTHAGAGRYSVDAKLVRDKAEYQTGVGRLWPMKDANMPGLIRDYMAQIRLVNDEQLQYLPGSALMLAQQLRPIDSLRACEIHPTDHPILQETLAPFGRKVKALKSDGFVQLKAALPPISRRALVLMDPSFEIKTDYDKAIAALRDAVARFASGCYVIWLPMLQRFEVDRFVRQVMNMPVANKLHVAFRVRDPLKDGLGLMGSHVIVLNPPYGLEQACREAMPWLVKQLGQDASASFELLKEAKPFVPAASAKGTSGRSGPTRRTRSPAGASSTPRSRPPQ
ncbi:MAG: 23S rRNA (adenine(2030)-N(6))-methyltransferase RlmJ [Burkholderiaceae bacterium]|jgi:23S rRNA (adenine2030-N6)-methyltransferase